VKPILARAERARLRRLASRRLLVALDYDGTLAPIVRRPERAALRLGTRGLLRRLAALYPCVVISGRSRRDLLRRLRGLGLAGLIGNHGGEPSPRRRALRARVRRWRATLEARLGALAGVTIEDKGLSLSIHYRGARRPQLARTAIRAAGANLVEARLVGGKQVVNVVPAEAPHKGAALEAERRRLGCDSWLYVGDDETDEDAFALAREARIGVRVGRKQGSRARYYLRGQAQVDALLELLVAARTPPSRRAARAARSSIDSTPRSVRTSWTSRPRQAAGSTPRSGR
jgi:trehalose 6-phosphate phosphatase